MYEVTTVNSRSLFLEYAVVSVIGFALLRRNSFYARNYPLWSDFNFFNEGKDGAVKAAVVPGYFPSEDPDRKLIFNYHPFSFFPSKENFPIKLVCQFMTSN